MSNQPHRTTFFLSLTALAFSSCSPGKMQKSADNEVFKILHSKSSVVPNSGQGLLDITPAEPLTLNGLAKNTKTDAFLGDRASLEKNARVVPLHEALQLAVTHNRDYQNRKELLYLEALNLTYERHEFSPIFSAATGTNVVSVPTTVMQQQVSTLVTNNTFTTTGDIGFRMLTHTGAKIAASFTTDFLKFISGNLTNASDSVLAVSLSQPLLRGAGYRATMENLTQAERSLMYSIRDFTQYRKTFTVDIASAYYRTVQAREIAKNAYNAFNSFETTLTGERALAKEDRRTSSQLGLIEQASLKYERLWISAVRNYEQQLDALKINLGIPVQTPVILDESELGKLSLEEPKFGMDESIQTAMVTRLDLDNARNEIEDSERKILIAKQNLLPQLDVSGSYALLSDPQKGKVNLDFQRHRYGGGLDLDLRLDKKADRNVYRSSLIAQQRATRQLDLAEENVRSTLRTDWRELDTARKQYEIAQTGVQLSARRLEEEQLLNELGKGTARDLIDAQQDLNEARDDLTAALISHTINRLKLYKDMGVLYIKKDGSWINVLKQEAIAIRND